MAARWAIEKLTPPHSVEAEQSVLGALLIDGTAWDQVGRHRDCERFLSPRSSPDLRGLGGLGRLGQARRRGHRVRAARAARPSSRMPAAWPISARWRAIHPRPPMSAPMRPIVRERALLRAPDRGGSRDRLLGFQRAKACRRVIWSIVPKQLVFEIAEQGTRLGARCRARQRAAAAADRQDRRVAQQSEQAARAGDRIHRFRSTRPAACAAAT